ncbi:ATP-binding cassette domain-containing protein [Desulfococcaceae bacterium HSG8]|nr:ATP-binding cassette domain-containing protein [Desulfococcaceae bacterium HSG8]
MADSENSNLLVVSDLTKYFSLNRGIFSKSERLVRAVEGVSFTVRKGESFGIVGESGCGKSTLGRMVIRLINPTRGRIEFDGIDIARLSLAEMRPMRRRMQIIFQDPYASLSPRMKVKEIVSEPLRACQGLSKVRRWKLAAGMLEKVGLSSDDLEKYPHEFSGGQRQRIGIARSLCIRPELIVADEPVSALDVSVQAQVINLMADLREEFNLSYIFISHDLSVVEYMCDRIAVMYLGMIVELAPVEVFSLMKQRHPYTEALMAAVPQPDPRSSIRLPMMEGDIPNPSDPPPGCMFHPRCQYASERCRIERPSLGEVMPEHFVACWK